MKAEKVITSDSGGIFREQDIVELSNHKEVITGRIIKIDIDKNKMQLDCSSQYREEVISISLSLVNNMIMSNLESWEDEYNKMATQAVEITEKLNEEIQKLKEEIKKIKQEND